MVITVHILCTRLLPYAILIAIHGTLVAHHV
jgi:hypothetical protein